MLCRAVFASANIIFLIIIHLVLAAPGVAPKERRLVEREGFEPSMPLSEHTRFPIVLFQPLRHLSVEITTLNLGKAQERFVLTLFAWPFRFLLYRFFKFLNFCHFQRINRLIIFYRFKKHCNIICFFRSFNSHFLCCFLYLV